MNTNHSSFLLVFCSIWFGFALLHNYGKGKKWRRSSFVIIHLLFSGTVVVAGVLNGFAEHVLQIHF